MMLFFRPKKKIPVFRVTPPYLNLLVKPRFDFRYSGKDIILCIFNGRSGTGIFFIWPKQLTSPHAHTFTCN